MASLWLPIHTTTYSSLIHFQVNAMHCEKLQSTPKSHSVKALIATSSPQHTPFSLRAWSAKVSRMFSPLSAQSPNITVSVSLQHKNLIAVSNLYREQVEPL